MSPPGQLWGLSTPTALWEIRRKPVRQCECLPGAWGVQLHGLGDSVLRLCPRAHLRYR